MFAKLGLGNKVIVIVNILICNWIYFSILGESKRKTSISLMTYDLITLIAILYNSCHIEGTHTDNSIEYKENLQKSRPPIQFI